MRPTLRLIADDRDFGAGLVNALNAVKAAKPRSRTSPEG